MGSFRKQKNKLLSIGVGFLYVAISLIGLVNFRATASAAPTNFNGANYFVVTRNDPTADNGALYKVIARVHNPVQNGIYNTINIPYYNGKYMSEPFKWSTVCDPSNAIPTIKSQAIYDFTIYAATDTNGTGTKYGTYSYDSCGTDMKSAQTVNISITNASTIAKGGIQTGGVQGTLTYNPAAGAPNAGTPKPWGATAGDQNPADGATLTDSSGAKHALTILADGTYIINDLPVGVYKLNASYTSTGSYVKTYIIYNKSITVLAGKTVDGSAVGEFGSNIDTSGGTVDTSSGPTLDCSVTLFNPLSWLLCPLATGLMSVAGGLDNAINSYMTVDTTTLQAYKPAWQIVRNIALGVLIIGALIAIIAQALGFEALDAYTMRKTLPRLAVVAVGISISWPLMLWFVQLTNDLGVGVRQLIYAPFPSDTYRIALGGGGTVVLGLIGGGAILALGFMALLSFAATAALAVAVAFLVLTLRQIVIVMLIIFAPIAIVCYLLPNTQKMWKLWWDTFSKTLLMFPIITGIIAIGRVFSAVTTTGSGGAGSSSAIQQLIGFVAYFAPYFMIPFTFRLAGGAIATIGGLANDKSRGGFDRLKKYRSNQSAKNMHAMKDGTRTNNRAFNALTSRATTSRFGLGRQGRAAYSDKQTLAAMEQAKTAGGQAIQHNDDALRALTYGSSAEVRANMKNDFRKNDGSTYSDEEIETAIASVKSSGGYGRARQVYAAQQLAATGTGYTEGAINQVAKTIARVSHGNEGQIASLAGNINSSTKGVGRHDLAPGFSTLNTLARQEAGVQSGVADYGTAAENAWNSASLYQHANDKPQNIKAAIAHYTPQLVSSSPVQRQNAAVFFNELKSMQPNASGEVKNHIQKALEDNRSSLNDLYDETHAKALPASGLGVQDRLVGGGAVTMRFDSSTGDYVKEVAPNTHRQAETAQQRVERLSRTYERPDPDRM